MGSRLISDLIASFKDQPGLSVLVGCAENVVPQPVAHPETVLRILVMVNRVVLLQLLEQRILPIEVMQAVVAQIVTQVAHHKSWEEGRYPLRTEYELEAEIEKEGQWHAHARNHHQSVTVARIIVVHTMENEVHTLTEIGRWHPMEHEAMQGVLGKTPNENTKRKEPCNVNPRDLFYRYCTIQEITEHRDEDDEWYAPMNTRELVDEVALEHAWTLVLVVDV